MVIISLLPAKISVRIYFKLRFYTKKRLLARAYDGVCQHRYLQQTVNIMSCFQGERERINYLYQQVLPVQDPHLFLANITLSESTTQTAAHKVRKKVFRPFLLVSVPQRQSITQYTISRLMVLGLQTAFVLRKFHVPSALGLDLCDVLNLHAIVIFVVIKVGTK
jgi:hypothetical protein